MEFSTGLMEMPVRHRLMSEYKPDAPARVTLRPIACAAGLYFHQPSLVAARDQLDHSNGLHPFRPHNM